LQLPYTLDKTAATMSLKMLIATILAVCLTLTAALVSPSQTRTATSLRMVPKYDGSRWVPTKFPDDTEGYPAWKTLLKHGPQPFFKRLTAPDDYEQAVYKFMAVDKVSRDEAQGNMDAYLRNPNDWAMDRMYAEKRGIKVDYVTLDPKALTLTLVWSSIVFAVIGRIIVAVTTGVNFWAFGPFV
jgi:hypothetical protein